MFTENQKVYIIPLQKFAYIVEQINQTSYAVLIDDMEYSAHINDIQATQSQDPTQNTRVVDRTKFEDFEEERTEVVFQVHSDKEGVIQRFDVFVKSFYNKPTFINIQTQINRKGNLKLARVFTPKELSFAFSLTFEDLDEKPTLTLITLNPQTQQPLTEKQEATLRPQLFFKEGIQYPKLDGKSYIIAFKQLQYIEPTAIAPKVNAQLTPEISKEFIERKAAFTPELDLHAESLGIESSNLLPFEIQNIQLEHVKHHIACAIEFSIDKVVFIHGIGNGTLRRKLHEYLDTEKRIKEFKNEYHPKYGFGATEVEFK